MGATTTAALSTMVAVNAVNISIAEQARDEQCEILISNFNSNSHTPKEEMHQYAECVERIYPTAAEVQSEKDFLKVSLILMIVCFVFGFVRAKRDGDDNMEALLHGLMYIFIGILASGASCAVIYAFS